jgi:transposase
MEACAIAHHWARTISALGHTVKMMPPAYVKPYVKRGKTDAADAEAICEAVTWPTMRFVAVKTLDKQGALMLHKTRDLLVRQRTMLINGLRGHLAEFGIIAAKGPGGVKAAIETLHEAQERLSEAARVALHGLVDQLRFPEQDQSLSGGVIIDAPAWASPEGRPRLPPSSSRVACFRWNFVTATNSSRMRLRSERLHPA